MEALNATLAFSTVHVFKRKETEREEQSGPTTIELREAESQFTLIY